MKDASQNALVAARLMNSEEGKVLKQKLSDKYENMRQEYRQEQEKLLSLDEARKKKSNLWSE
jgi:5-methyltetrahydrofolate--homocysteine methyltransferase